MIQLDRQAQETVKLLTKEVIRDAVAKDIALLEGHPVCSNDDSHVHYHRTASGVMLACYHKCRLMFTWQFWCGLTLGYPIEHLLWEKVWPFYEVAKWLKLFE